jgi:hypothetical protein
MVSPQPKQTRDRGRTRWVDAEFDAWKKRGLVSGQQLFVDEAADSYSDWSEDDEGGQVAVAVPRRTTQHEVSLVDIACPAKHRGKSRAQEGVRQRHEGTWTDGEAFEMIDFEVESSILECLSNLSEILLFSDEEGDKWEVLSGDKAERHKPLYSAIVSGADHDSG